MGYGMGWQVGCCERDHQWELQGQKNQQRDVCELGCGWWCLVNQQLGSNWPGQVQYEVMETWLVADQSRGLEQGNQLAWWFWLAWLISWLVL